MAEQILSVDYLQTLDPLGKRGLHAYTSPSEVNCKHPAQRNSATISASDEHVWIGIREVRCHDLFSLRDYLAQALGALLRH